MTVDVVAVDLVQVAFWVVMAPFLLFVLVLSLRKQGHVTKSETEIWHVAAEELGFDLTLGKRGLAESMRGERRGREVELKVWHQESVSMENHAGTRHTSFIVHYETGGPAFELHARSDASKLVRSFVSQNDTAPGLELFDQYVELHAEDRDAAVRYLTPIRRAAVLGFFRSGPGVSVSHERLVVPFTLRFDSVEQVIDRVDELLDVADLLCEQTASDASA